MASFSGDETIELALRRVGELLEAEGRQHRIVIIGGPAMNLLGLVDRATRTWTFWPSRGPTLPESCNYGLPMSHSRPTWLTPRRRLLEISVSTPTGSTLDQRHSGAPACRRGWSAGWSGAVTRVCGSE